MGYAGGRGIALAVLGLFVSAASAGATPPATCSGDLSNPPGSLGTLTGTYSGNVEVSGACAADAGAVTINGT